MASLQSSQQRNYTPNCDRCSQPTTLAVVLQRLGSTPGYRIFECDTCHILTWVAEQVT
jgi:hypothetical protein